jgi:hypothetical protein
MGLLLVPTDGNYSIYSKGSGHRVWIDANLVTSNINSSGVEFANTLALTKGLHPIMLSMCNGWVGGSITVSWAGPGITKVAIPNSALYYNLTGVPAGVAGSSVALPPNGFALAGASPNPFQGTTQIRFSVPAQQEVSLRLYDVSGRLVKVVAEQTMPAGNHTVSLHAAADNGRLVDGVYYLRMRANGFEKTQRITVMR